MDADLSHSPEYIPKMLQLLDKYQVVVGSRYITNGLVDEDWHWTRKFLSWIGNYAIRKIVITTGEVTTFAGGSGAGYVDGVGTDAKFSYPRDIVTDGTSLYVVGWGDAIRKIDIASGLDSRST